MLHLWWGLPQHSVEAILTHGLASPRSETWWAPAFYGWLRQTRVQDHCPTGDSISYAFFVDQGLHLETSMSDCIQGTDSHSVDIVYIGDEPRHTKYENDEYIISIGNQNGFAIAAVSIEYTGLDFCFRSKWGTIMDGTKKKK